mgnify:CR=1 FL=1
MIISSLKDLKQDKHNANKGTARGSALVRQSLEDVGPWRSIGVDANGVIGVGNKTGKTWKELANPDDVIVVQTDGTKLVVVQRVDLDLEAEDEEARNRARRAAYYDNRAAELNLEWEIGVIRADWKNGIGLDTMWEPTDLFTQNELMSEQATGFLSQFLAPSPQPAAAPVAGGTSDTSAPQPASSLPPDAASVAGGTLADGALPPAPSPQPATAPPVATGDIRSNYTFLTLTTSLAERDYIMATLQSIVREHQVGNVAEALVWLCEEYNGDHDDDSQE